MDTAEWRVDLRLYYSQRSCQRYVSWAKLSVAIHRFLSGFRIGCSTMILEGAAIAGADITCLRSPFVRYCFYRFYDHAIITLMSASVWVMDS